MISLRAFESPMTSPREMQTVENAIHLVRGQRVMLDSDLAGIYGVTTKRLNEQLKRNQQRFPQDFAFQLTTEEFATLRSQIATSNLKSQFATSSSHGGKRKLQLFAATRQLLAPAPAKKREIGFHVRERQGRYRARGRA